MMEMNVPEGIGIMSHVEQSSHDDKEFWEVILDTLKHFSTEIGENRLLNQNVNLFVATFLCHFGLIEFGVNLRSGWLTEDGAQCLQFLNDFGINWRNNTEHAFIDKHGTHLN
jgi:hypothetical protein